MSDPLTQARDRIAELCGWKPMEMFDDPPGITRVWWLHQISPTRTAHPIPACLNWVSKVWPDGVAWRRVWEYYDEADDYEDYTGYLKWYATIRIGTDEKLNVSGLRDSGDELTDRMTLLAGVLAWLQSNDPPAFAAVVERIKKEIRG